MSALRAFNLYFHMIQGLRAALRLRFAPGYPMPRLRRYGLATFWRACGAADWLPYAAPPALSIYFSG